MELLSTFIMWLSRAVCSRDITMYLVLSAFTSSPISLVATTRASAFSFTVCMLPPSILTSSAQARSWCVPFHFKPSWFTGTLLMAYSKAKLNSNGDRASPNVAFFYSVTGIPSHDGTTRHAVSDAMYGLCEGSCQHTEYVLIYSRQEVVIKHAGSTCSKTTSHHQKGSMFRNFRQRFGPLRTVWYGVWFSGQDFVNKVANLSVECFLFVHTVCFILKVDFAVFVFSFVLFRLSYIRPTSSSKAISPHSAI